MVAAFASAARLGIMIKRTSTLEAAASVDTVVLDKTGTITTGRFAVSRLAPAEGVDGADLLRAAADAEQSSNHPLARSILETAERANLVVSTVSEYEEVHGRGVRAQRDGAALVAGRGGWLRELFPQQADAIAQAEEKIDGMSGVHVALGDQYLGRLVSKKTAFGAPVTPSNSTWSRRSQNCHVHWRPPLGRGTGRPSRWRRHHRSRMLARRKARRAAVPSRQRAPNLGGGRWHQRWTNLGHRRCWRGDGAVGL